MVKVLFWDVTNEGANFWFATANTVLILGAIAVAVGTIGAIAMGGAKEYFADARIAENEAETARALERAAEANLKAEQEKLARLVIEQRLAPRFLNDSQQSRIADKIRRFSGQRFQFVSYQDDPEVKGFVVSLLQTLVSAGWEGVPVQEFLMGNVVLGVTIEVPSSKENSFRLAAESLAEALQSEGVTASVQLNSSLDSKAPDQIRIKVGKKP